MALADGDSNRIDTGSNLLKRKKKMNVYREKKNTNIYNKGTSHQRLKDG